MTNSTPLWSGDDAGAGTVISATHTHIPSLFQQSRDDEAAHSTYFDQRVPVPEDQSQVNMADLLQLLVFSFVTGCEGNMNMSA